MRVLAAGFHPMRGHVEDGCIVLFSDGRELTVKSHGGGWALFDGDGRQVSRQANGAMDLTAVVVQMEA